MRRREFVALMGASVTWPFAALAQQAGRTYRLGCLLSTPRSEYAALFDELRPQLPRVENAAGRIVERYFACFSARDWAAMAELLADDIVVDDRRRVVNAGVRRGRDVFIADTRASVEVGADTISSSVIATRSERPCSTRAHKRDKLAPPHRFPSLPTRYSAS